MTKLLELTAQPKYNIQKAQPIFQLGKFAPEFQVAFLFSKKDIFPRQLGPNFLIRRDCISYATESNVLQKFRPTLELNRRPITNGKKIFEK